MSISKLKFKLNKTKLIKEGNRKYKHLDKDFNGANDSNLMIEGQ